VEPTKSVKTTVTCSLEATDPPFAALGERLGETREFDVGQTWDKPRDARQTTSEEFWKTGGGPVLPNIRLADPPEIQCFGAHNHFFGGRRRY
jgi:hypothetical protein